MTKGAWCLLSMLSVTAGLMVLGSASAGAATYEPAIGALGHYTFETTPLSDRMEIRANVATGNLMVASRDLSIAGTGVPLSITRTFNNLDPAGAVASAGRRDMLSVGEDVRLEIPTSGPVVYIGPSGFRAPFTRSGGAFTSPTGMNSTLTQAAGGEYTLTENASGTKEVFSSAGTMLRQEDRNGNRITYAYTGGRLTAITDTQGRAVAVARNADGTVASITDSTGRRITYGYDASLNLTEVIDPAFKRVQFAYSVGSNNLTQITDAQGERTTLAYDSSRRVTSITRDAGAKTSFAYNSASTAVTDPRGFTTTYTYDAENRVTRVVDARNKATSLAYTPNSDVDWIITPNNQATGRRLAASYDSLNNLTRVGKPAGQVSTIAYQSAGFPYLPSSATDAQGATTNFGYDPRGNVASITGGTAAENQSTLAYNPNGTLRTSTDALGQTTSFGYDAKGNLVSIDRVSPLGDEAFGYDTLSRLTSYTDGKGQTTTYTYDKLDRRTKSTAADASTVTYAFDGNGNLTSRKDSPGKTTTYRYDSSNRLETEAVFGQTGTSYDYDLAGNVTSLLDQGGEVNYEYGPTGRLDALVEPGGARTTFAYDDNGNRIRTAYPNGVTLSESWTPSDQVERVSTNSPARSFTYSYIGPLGNNVDLRQRVDATGPYGTSYTYRYDALGRLKQATAAGADTTYTYDRNSNLVAKSVVSVGQSMNTQYAIGAANRLLSFATTANPSGGPTPAASYTYDANGNELGGSRTWGYNPRNQATTAPATPSGGTLAQTFLGEGQAERASEGATTFRYSRVGPSSRNDASGTTYVTRDNDGRVVSER